MMWGFFLSVCALQEVSSELLVFGGGHARTGTASMKVALELLGFGPTYHMWEVGGVSENSLNLAYKVSHINDWMEAQSGPPDFDKLFRNYSSAVDAPAVFWFEELLRKYPEAKVILTKRSSSKAWAQSINGAMCMFIDEQRALGWLRSTAYFKAIHPSWSKFIDMLQAMDNAATRWSGQEHNWQRICQDPEYAERLIDAWNQQVEELVPAERLLVFETGKHSWKELCSFLEVPEPAVPYPRVNNRFDFLFICCYYWAEVLVIYCLPSIVVSSWRIFLLIKRRKGKLA